MSNSNIPELTYLLSEVERKYNRRIATTNDFESLSVVIEHYTGEDIFDSKGVSILPLHHTHASATEA